MPPTHGRQRRWTWLPMPVEIAAGKRPMQADKAVINIGRIRWLGGLVHRLDRAHSGAACLIVIGDDQDAFITETPKQRHETDRGGMLKSSPVTNSAMTPPAIENGIPARARRPVAQRIETGHKAAPGSS